MVCDTLVQISYKAYFKVYDLATTFFIHHVNFRRPSFKIIVAIYVSASVSGTKRCGNVTCGVFGYCNKTNGSCQCENGFEWDGQKCTGEFLSN